MNFCILPLTGGENKHLYAPTLIYWDYLYTELAHRKTFLMFHRSYQMLA